MPQLTLSRFFDRMDDDTIRQFDHIMCRMSFPIEDIFLFAFIPFIEPCGSDDKEESPDCTLLRSGDFICPHGLTISYFPAGIIACIHFDCNVHLLSMILHVDMEK